MKQLFTKHWPVITYLTIYTFIFGLKIIWHPLPFFDWDESIYAQVGREMVNNWSLIPLWQGEYWLDKPPLVPLFYGVVATLTPFLMPEISTRLATLCLSVVALILLYMLYIRVIKESLLTTLMVTTTSLTSIFLQRAQVLNVDVFLLVGWLGYIVYFKRFWVSLLFLSFAVYSKSLIGFYPTAMVGLFFAYQYLTKKITAQDFFVQIKKILLQVGILSLWYIVMFARFGEPFLYQHFYESHVKRVTASIESHFGKRTFYIDLLFEQYGAYAFVSVLGFATIIWQWFKKQLSNTQVLYALFLTPWFLFLNLTKTKIFWYGHPYLGQFAFFMLYPLVFFKRFRLWYNIAIILIGGALLQHYFIQQNVLNEFYASVDPHHIVAKEASSSCEVLYVIIEPEGREASQTLESMDLLITTSRWWGNHPSMIYYFTGEVVFVYTLEELHALKNMSAEQTSCIAVNEQDKEALEIISTYQEASASYPPYVLYMHAY